MAISQNFPTVRPTLNLNFARSKTLDPRITFERSSIGTYVDEDGLIKTASADQARFDHDPVTGESLGLLIEEQRTNIALNSEDFSTRSATTFGTKSSVTTNATISPDGTQSADLVTTVTTTTQNRLGNLHSVTTGQVYTYSVYVKQGNKSNVTFYLGYTSLINASVSFTFSTEGISGSGASYIANSAGFEKLNNGWYRIYFSGSSFGSGNTYSGFISDTTPDQTFYIWGEQIEVGSFPTSYIPTSGSTVTRSADNAQITGTNFSSWYNQSEGSIYGSWRRNGNTSNTVVVSTDDGSSNNRIELRPAGGNSGLFRFEVVQGGVTGLVSINTIPNSGLGNSDKAIFAYKLDDYAASGNGSSAVTDTSSVVPVVNRMILGDSTFGVKYNGTIDRVSYYPERLTNEQLQNLTK